VEKGELKMALTIKHKADGSYYEQGDTQGIMIPTALPKVILNATFPHTDTGNHNIDSATVLIPGQLDFGTVSGKKLFVPEGWYFVYLPGALLNAANSYKYTFAASYTAADVIFRYTQVFCSVNDVYQRNEGTGLILVPPGGYLVMGFYQSGGGGITNGFLSAGDRFVVMPCAQREPDIIANKGALVSSNDPGKISFDDTGVMSLNSPLTSFLSTIQFTYPNLQNAFGQFYRKNGWYWLELDLFFASTTTVPFNTALFSIPPEHCPPTDILISVMDDYSTPTIIYKLQVFSDGLVKNVTNDLVWNGGQGYWVQASWPSKN
jgi:hypothetical protein